MVPAQIMTAGVAMFTDTLTQPLYFGDKLFTRHLIKIGVHSVVSTQQRASQFVACLMTNPPKLVEYTDLSLAILISAKAARKARARPGCARFVPEPGQNIHLPLSKKK